MSPALRQGSLILVASIALGFGANAFRAEPLPLSGEIGPPAAPEPGSDLPAIAADEARAAWEGGAVFVDVRPHEDWAARRAAGASSMDALDFPNSYYALQPPLDAAVPLVVYGAGPDSFAVRRVAAELRALGHAEVTLVVVGIESLFAAGVPEETGGTT